VSIVSFIGLFCKRALWWVVIVTSDQLSLSCKLSLTSLLTVTRERDKKVSFFSSLVTITKSYMWVRVHVRVCVCACACVHVCVRVWICEFVCMPARICLFVCPFVLPSVCLSVFLSVCLSVNLYVYQSMGWLQLVGSFKLQVSCAEYSLFYRALLQKRPIILRSLLIVATPYQSVCQSVCMSVH